MFDKNVRPRHITFSVKTSTEERETNDFRLTKLKSKAKLCKEASVAAKKKKLEDKLKDVKGKVDKKSNRLRRLLRALQSKKDCPDKPKTWYQREENNDIVFFRLGYLNYMKLNEENMV